MKVCVVGASGKLGKYMVQHALDRGYDVVGVCREQSVPKPAEFEGTSPKTARTSIHGS
jgi:putative NADH-flavin reductase